MNPFTATPRHDDATDLPLLQQYRNTGDLAVLGKLYKPYMPLVYGVCLKYLKDEELCKDAVMQIFEQLIDKAKQHEIKQFKGWLYVLSRNYCLMQLRSGKKMEMIGMDDIMENTFLMHHDNNEAEKEPSLQALERCMEKLPAAQKESVDLFYYQEKCYRDIADKTGYTLNEVKSYIQNGKRNLKICLEKNGER